MRNFVITSLALCAMACEPGSNRIRYDPAGDWVRIEQPSHDIGNNSNPKCVDAQGDLPQSLQVVGTFPGYGDATTIGEVVLGDRTVEAEFMHNVGAGASAMVSWGREEESQVTLPSGGTVEYLDFYSDKTLRVLVTTPGYCWTWYEQQ